MDTLKQLFQLVKPYSARVVMALLLLLGITAVDMIMPAIIRQVIDEGLLGGQKSLILYAALLIFGLGIFKTFLMHWQTYTNGWISQQTAFDLRNRLYNHIQHLSFSYHDHIQSGQLISRCIEDVRSVQNFTGNGLTNLSRVAALMIGIVLLLFLENARLAVFALLPLIPLVFIATSFGGRMSRIYYKVDHALGELSSRLQENVAGAQVVRAFAREEYEITRFEEADQTLYKAQVRSMREFAKVLPGTHALVALSTILILWFGGNMVMQGELTLGELVAFNSYLVLLALPVQQLAWLVNQASEASAGLKRTFEVLQTCPEIRSKKNAILPGTLQGKIEFRDVCFKYQGEKSPALHNINLTVEPNQVIALIGGTGSGKTSMINMIPRFYDVSEGKVLIDGMDVRELQIEALRKQIGIVLQSTLLFSMSIKDNLAYGNPDLSFEEIIEAAKMAQAHEFILELPEGYDTIVGERGVTLSGGQRQRVAIARAILMDPRILILDDSTSSVDTRTEKLIQQALYRLMEGRTTFVIAQRLSTVQRADRILVMDQGTIVEQGTHTELLEKGGIYKKIYSLQLRDQETTLELNADEGDGSNA